MLSLKMLSKMLKKRFSKKQFSKFYLHSHFCCLFQVRIQCFIFLKNIVEYLPRYFARLKINNISGFIESKRRKYTVFTAWQVIYNVFHKMYWIVKEAFYIDISCINRLDSCCICPITFFTLMYQTDNYHKQLRAHENHIDIKHQDIQIVHLYARQH